MAHASRLRGGTPFWASRSSRLCLVALLVPTLLAGCEVARPTRQPEGTIAFQGGSSLQAANQTHVVPGPPFQRPGMLTPTRQQAWKSEWVEPDKKEHPMMRGASAGMTTGIGLLLITPMAATFWPAAVGIMAGSIAAGMLGGSLAGNGDVRMSPPDQAVILAATEKLQPERLLRESFEQALSRRSAAPLATVAWDSTQGPDTTATDPLVDVRDRQLDGVVECGEIGRAHV